MGRPMTSANDFVVDTIGHCFNCLKEVKAHGETLRPVMPKPYSSVTSPTHSLLHLSRYLKIKMSKVFQENENDSIPQHLLDKVERSTLKVSLCEQCARWNAKLSQLFQQLEKIEVEATSYLELYNRKALEADENGRCKVFRKLDDSKSVDGLTGKLKLEIAEAIRGETMQKCTLKLSTVQPKIKIEKIQEKKILWRVLPHNMSPNSGVNNQERCREQITEHLATSKGGIHDVKMECQNDTSNDHFEDSDYLGEQNENFEQPHFAEETVNAHDSWDYQAKNTVTSTDHLKHRKKLDTGKYGCDLCSKELVSDGAFYTHYQSAHLGIRFQCSICNKIFTLKGNLTKHQQKVHCK